jgi:hypothetical protein
MKCFTLSKKLDEVDRHRFQVFAHFLVSCEEQIWILSKLPRVQNVGNERVVIGQVSSEEFSVVREAPLQA